MGDKTPAEEFAAMAKDLVCHIGEGKNKGELARVTKDGKLTFFYSDFDMTDHDAPFEPEEALALAAFIQRAFMVRHGR